MITYIFQPGENVIDLETLYRSFADSLYYPITTNGNTTYKYYNYTSTDYSSKRTCFTVGAGSSGSVEYVLTSGDTPPPNYNVGNNLDIYFLTTSGSSTSDYADVKILLPPIRYHYKNGSNYGNYLKNSKLKTSSTISLSLVNPHPTGGNWGYSVGSSGNCYLTYNVNETYTYDGGIYKDAASGTSFTSDNVTAPCVHLMIKRAGLSNYSGEYLKGDNNYGSGQGWVELLLRLTVQDATNDNCYYTLNPLKIRVVKLNSTHSVGANGEQKFFIGNKYPTAIYMGIYMGLVPVKEVYLGSVKVWPVESTGGMFTYDSSFGLRLSLNGFKFYTIGNNVPYGPGISTGSVYASIDFTIYNPTEDDYNLSFNSYKSIQAIDNGENFRSAQSANNNSGRGKVKCGLLDKYTLPYSDGVVNTSLRITNNTDAVIKWVWDENNASAWNHYSHSGHSCSEEYNNHQNNSNDNNPIDNSRKCQTFLKNISSMTQIFIRVNLLYAKPDYPDQYSSEGAYYYVNQTHTGVTPIDSNLNMNKIFKINGNTHYDSSIYRLASKPIVATYFPFSNLPKTYAGGGTRNSSGWPDFNVYSANNATSQLEQLNTMINQNYGYLNHYEIPNTFLCATSPLTCNLNVEIYMPKNTTPPEPPDPSWDPCIGSAVFITQYSILSKRNFRYITAYNLRNSSVSMGTTYDENWIELSSPRQITVPSSIGSGQYYPGQDTWYSIGGYSDCTWPSSGTTFNIRFYVERYSDAKAGITMYLQKTCSIQIYTPSFYYVELSGNDPALSPTTHTNSSPDNKTGHMNLRPNVYGYSGGNLNLYLTSDQEASVVHYSSIIGASYDWQGGITGFQFADVYVLSVIRDEAGATLSQEDITKNGVIQSYGGTIAQCTVTAYGSGGYAY